MAVIDLKNTTLKIRDGGTKTYGAVNHAGSTQTDGVSSASLGVSTFTIDALPAAKYKGQKFNIESDTTDYYLTADADASATAIFFEPVLAVAIVADKDVVWASGYAAGVKKMVVDGFSSEVSVGEIVNFPGSIENFIVQALDNATTPTIMTLDHELDVDVANDAVITASHTANEVEIVIGEGNLTYSEKREFEYKLNRGALDTVREGDEQPMDVSFDLQWEFLRYASGDDDAVPTVEEALKRTGLASTWRSTSDDPCEPYCVDIIIENNPGCGSEGLSETIILPDFRWETMDHDAQNGSISCSGRCNAKIAVVARNIL
jgi:hypothetical protein